MMTGNQFPDAVVVMTKNPRMGTAKAAATMVATIAASVARGVAMASIILARPPVAGHGAQTGDSLVKAVGSPGWRAGGLGRVKGLDHPERV